MNEAINCDTTNRGVMFRYSTRNVLKIGRKSGKRSVFTLGVFTLGNVKQKNKVVYLFFVTITFFS